jgi:hypothetical protein
MPSTASIPIPTVRQPLYRCRMCGHTHPESELRNGPSGNRYCQRCFEQEFFTCGLCGAIEYNHARREWSDTPAVPAIPICPRCYRDCTTWEIGTFSAENPNYKKTRSPRGFGLELETSDCPNYRTLKGKTNFGVKFDCSVNGMEFYSPVLSGDEGLAAVEEFLQHADRLDFDVDSDCGYHLHLDMRGEDIDALKSVAYAYMKADAAWRLLVDSFRANDCGYCRRPQYTRRDVEAVSDRSDMRRFCDNQDRYLLCNLNAYTKFGSFEIRLHQGSLDARAVCNWIKAHLRFTDWAKDKTLDEIDDAFRGSDVSRWESLKAIFGDIDLNRYYGRIRRGRLNESGERERAESVA